MKENWDVLIVGCGAAGLYCALNLPENQNVCMICKEDIEHSDSYLAQGGISMLRGEDDYQEYFNDTLRAGHYENDPKSVDLMIRYSNTIINDLIKHGVDFEKDHDGRLCFTKEGAHSKPRILYHEDETGKEITSRLLLEAKKRKNIHIYPYCMMIDLLEKDNRAYGIVVQKDQTIFPLFANSIVLACGGIGGIFKNSTNYESLQGDALSICLHHHVELENIDYIQIHPTTLYSTKKGRRFLLSESLRGEGARLLNIHGKRFVNELLPRDLLTDKINEQMRIDHSDHVFLDLTPIGETALRTHFPHICSRCQEEGYDVFHEPIPVVQAQHYFMGGIKIDLSGKTSMKDLYACGETSCSNVHGRNRLASNSLLESLVFAKKAAEDIMFSQFEPKALLPFTMKKIYQDTSKLMQDYQDELWSEIERWKLIHERNNIEA